MFRLVLVFLSVLVSGPSAAITSDNSGQDPCKPCFRVTGNPNDRIENKVADVTSLDLDKSVITTPLPVGSPPGYPDVSREMIIGVNVTSHDPEGDPLVHSYTVSGGRIIGQGTKVLWDLNRVVPGTYTITAAADDGCGYCGKTVMKTATVLENENAPKCVCSKITIDAPYMKTGQATSTFTAHLTGPERPGLAFNWTISEGMIRSGQGTPTIKVEPSDDPRGRPVKVTVEVSGLDIECECPTSATRDLRY